MQAPPPAGAGTSFTITVTTQNQGVGASEATTTAIYLSANALFEATDQRVFEVGIGPLSPGASVTSTATIAVPSELAAELVTTSLGFADARSGQVREFRDEQHVSAAAEDRARP